MVHTTIKEITSYKKTLHNLPFKYLIRNNNKPSTKISVTATGVEHTRRRTAVPERTRICSKSGVRRVRVPQGGFAVVSDQPEHCINIDFNGYFVCAHNVCVCTGQRVEQIMDLVNAEEQSFSFFVVQSSLLCDDQQSSLTVHPMTGTVTSKDKLVTLLHNWPIKISVYCFKIIIPDLLCVELTNHYRSYTCFPVS